MSPRLFSLLAFLIVLGAPLAAHPHVWIDVKSEMTVAGGYVEGVWASWTFDDVFSQLILADNDSDSDGKISETENANLKRTYFDNLKAYQYYSHLVLGNKTLAIPEPQRFRASVTGDGRVNYRFFLPLGLRLDAKTSLSVAFYDDSFFTDMMFDKKEPLTLKITDGGKGSVALRPDKTKTFYGGQITPTFAVVVWGPS